MANFSKKDPSEVETVSIESRAENPSGGALGNKDGLVKTELIFHPDWEISNQEKYVYMYQHQMLPLLVENQLSIDGLKLLRYADGFVVVAFLRNTSKEAVKFETITLLLLDESGTPLAKKVFEMDNLGEIPAEACIPWRFLFEDQFKLVEDIPDEGWSLAFSVDEFDAPPHHLDLEESWERQMTPAQRDELEVFVSGLPAVAPNEVNIIGHEAKLIDEGKLSLTVLFRNGSSQELQLGQLPLAVEDATGKVVCQGSFNLNEFKVKPNTTKPWTFIFPKELLTTEAPDLSSWRVLLP